MHIVDEPRKFPPSNVLTYTVSPDRVSALRNGYTHEVDHPLPIILLELNFSRTSLIAYILLNLLHSKLLHEVS